MFRYFTSSLAFWILSFQFISIITSFSIHPDLHFWYKSIEKSSFTPPGYVFGIVWPFLYLTLSIFGYRLYNKLITVKERKLLFILFAVQTILNWLWSPVFFNLHLVRFALTILAIMILINSYITLRLAIIRNTNVYLILPYLLWLCFALYLNSMIVILN